MHETCANLQKKNCDAGNYEPVSLATTTTKLFKHYTSFYISPFFTNAAKQFGFSHNMWMLCVHFYCE